MLYHVLPNCSHGMVRGPAVFGLVLTFRGRANAGRHFLFFSFLLLLTADRHGAMIASTAADYGRTGRHKLEDGRPLLSRNGRD